MPPAAAHPCTFDEGRPADGAPIAKAHGAEPAAAAAAAAAPRTPASGQDRSGDPLRSLLRAAHLLAAHQLAASVAEHAQWLGAVEAVVYLADYEQARLVPLPGDGVPARKDLSVEGSLAGLAFRRVETLTNTTSTIGSPADDIAGDGAGLHRLWVPMLNGVERLGVLELVLPAPLVSPALEEEVVAFVSLVAELVVVNDQYSDAFARLRRRKRLSLAAEIQWDLLPPLTFGTDQVVITGALEPAYDIGGDTFDYSVTGDLADLLVLDSVGHGLPAAMLASVAVGAYRHARRDSLDLPDIAAAMNEVIAEQFGASQFATAVLARLDIDSGQLRWINAGHPAPMILRGPALVAPPACPPARPLGLQESTSVVCQTRLEPGDRLLLHTDGITEARSPAGEFFGEARLADFIAAATAAGDAAPETTRRLMRHVLDHQAGHLQDDASIVLLEWRTGQEQHLQL